MAKISNAQSWPTAVTRLTAFGKEALLLGGQGLSFSESSHQLKECVLHQCLGVDVRLGDFDVVQ